MWNLLRNDIRIYDVLVKLRRRKNNAIFQKVIKKVASIDSILAFDEFAESVECLVKQEVPVEYSVYGNESYYYGYYHEFMQYANMKIKHVPLFPRMEHGIRFGQPKWAFDENALAYACQSRHRIHEIWENDPVKLVFSLGPYIHYAREYYDEKTFLALKKQLGKVLLVFPSHTAEADTETLCETNFVDIIYNKYAHQFDTVVVCAYWRDAKSPVIKEFRERGAMIVSAGFRGDLNFIRRLKTIIRLADAAVGDDLGTNIGFCLNMKCPYYLEEVEEIRTVDSFFEENKKVFYQAFHTETLEFTPDQKQAQQILYQKWWGGDGAVYSPNEAKRLIKMLMSIYGRAHYQINNLPDVIRKMLCELKRDSLEYKMLSNAVNVSEF